VIGYSHNDDSDDDGIAKKRHDMIDHQLALRKARIANAMAAWAIEQSKCDT